MGRWVRLSVAIYVPGFAIIIHVLMRPDSSNGTGGDPVCRHRSVVFKTFLLFQLLLLLEVTTTASTTTTRGMPKTYIYTTTFTSSSSLLLPVVLLDLRS